MRRSLVVGTWLLAVGSCLSGWCQTSNFKHQTSNFKHQTSNLKLQTSNLKPPSAEFEKIALVDSFDEITCTDTETKAGTRAIVDCVLKTGATHVFWRNQSGSVPRYPSREEDRRKLQNPLDKRRIGWNAPYGWARLDQGVDAENLIAYAFEDLRAKGRGTGIHFTFEENHYANFTFGPWNLDHPQFWCMTKDGTPWPGRSSFGYDEVFAHKMRLVDELIAMGAETLYLDLWRDGAWSPRLEFTPKLVAEFKAEYGHEPSGKGEDAEWLKFYSRYTERYMRGIRARCDAAPRKVRFFVALARMAPWGREENDRQWLRYALDWKKLAAEGVFDGLVVAGVDFDSKDPWGSTKATYERVYRHRGKAKVYYHCSVYDYVKGVPSYMKATGLAAPQVAQKLLDLARECQGDGIVMEVVDWGNYSPAICDVIRNFQ